MNKIISFLLVVIIGNISCKNSAQDFDKLEIAKKFYVAINNSNHIEMNKLIGDSITTIDDGFEQEYSQNEYIEWVKWDSIFQPSYEIVKIEEENGIVKARITKLDERILFLHQEPMVTNEILQFKDDKIRSVNRISESFKVERFVTNRDNLVNWIAQNHPELNGFLYDQSKSGGINYLKAIEFYKAKK